MSYVFFFQAEDGIRDLVRSRGLGDVYKRQTEMGFGVSKRLIDGRIADIPAFAGVAGSFDQTAFLSLIHI